MTDVPKNTLIYHHRTQAVDAQGIHIHEMCRAFRELGWNVEMVALVSDEAVGKVSRQGEAYDLLAKIPPFLYEILEIGYNFVGFWRLYRRAKRTKPSFIYERYSLFNFAGILVSVLTGIPLMEEINAPLVYEKKKYDHLFFVALARFIEKSIINFSHKTIVVTSSLRNMLLREGARRDKMIVMHNGVNRHDFFSNASPFEGKANPSKPSKGRFCTIGFVGWFRDWHGLAEVIRSMKDRNWGEKGVRLLLVGDGPSRPDLENEIHENGVESYVAITGEASRGQVLSHLAEIDIALQPAATSYACPMKLIEYMASGKAIVAPCQENIRELIAHEMNGLLFKPGDWKDFSGQVERLINDGEMIRRLGREARRTVINRGFTWKENARRVLDLFAR